MMELEKELKQKMEEITPIDRQVMEAAWKNWDGLCKPLRGLGWLEEALVQIAGIMRDDRPHPDKRAVVIMGADNGVVKEGVTQTDQSVTMQVLENMGNDLSTACVMSHQAGCDMIPVNIGGLTDGVHPKIRNRVVRYGTGNIAKEPAMTREECVKAILTGIEIVKELKEEGYQLIVTGEMGIGNTTTSSMLVAALTGRTAEEVTGRGAGLNDAGLLRKQQVIAQALEKYEKEIRSAHALSMLAAFGGLDIAGMAGVCIGGALYHVPVVLDGLISSVAALVAERIVPGVREFVLPSHLSKEPAAKWIAEELKLHPVIDAGLGLGEGTGAVMLFSLLDLALALYEDQTTFDTMEIAQYERYGETE